MKKTKVCPDCGSDKITKFSTYDYVVGRDIKTGKILYRDKKPELGPATLTSCRCRDCGWDGETITLVAIKEGDNAK